MVRITKVMLPSNRKNEIFSKKKIFKRETIFNKKKRGPVETGSTNYCPLYNFWAERLSRKFWIFFFKSLFKNLSLWGKCLQNYLLYNNHNTGFNFSTISKEKSYNTFFNIFRTQKKLTRSHFGTWNLALKTCIPYINLLKVVANFLRINN